MKLYRIRIQLVLVLAASVASLFFGSCFMKAQDDKRPSLSNTDIAAAELVSQQAAAVIHAMMNEKPGGLRLRQAVLTLQTGTALEKGIEINLVIFTLSNKKKIGLTDTTTLSFDDKQLQEFAADFVPPPSLDQQFKQQLDEAVKLQMGIDWGKHKSIAIKKEFAVTKDTKGGLTFKITTPVSASGGFTIDRTKTSVNSLQLTYSE